LKHNHSLWRTAIVAGALFSCHTLAQTPAAPVSVTLDQAIQMALHHNHNILAARSTIQQSEALEITANLRPNPTFFTDWEYLPLQRPAGGVPLNDYLHDSTEGDIGVSYLFERGKKRQHRLQAAKDATAVVRSQVADNERSLTFQVAQLFINVQTADATLDVSEKLEKSFEQTVNISEAAFKNGSMSENDFLKMKLQLLQFQQDVEAAILAKAQALSDLRQLLGYESVPGDYAVTGPFDYQPLHVTLADLQTAALANRPDLRAAVQGVTAAGSQVDLAKADGKVDVTGSGNYSHVNGISAFTWSLSVPIPVFNRNQGEILRTQHVVTQSQQQEAAARGQVLTDVRDAYEALESSARVAQYFKGGYLEMNQKSRDITEYAYHRGAASLLDFLDAERTYRGNLLAWEQAISAYLTALEQLREAVGTRTLP
jgi:cobalt-zinc-cadmium efflux system outer membrane protein